MKAARPKLSRAREGFKNGSHASKRDPRVKKVKPRTREGVVNKDMYEIEFKGPRELSYETRKLSREMHVNRFKDPRV